MEFRMSSVPQTAASLDDLHRVEGKAELIAGRIVHLMPTGFRPGQVGGRIYRSLDDRAVSTGHGVALPDNVVFVVPELSSGRQTFSPDASFFRGVLPADGMDFIEGPPTLAVEVRSKGDYGKAIETLMAAKRADYFEAGTQVVWDVDPNAELVRVYRATTPDHPTVFRRGQVADAEPAIPGWRLSVEQILA
jgi:Uma2 family endonuclease